MSYVAPPCPFDPAVPEGETVAKFALLECSDGDMHMYWRLAVETSNYLRTHGENRRWFDEDAASGAAKVIKDLPDNENKKDFVNRWQAWGKLFEQIRDASPRYRLIDLISWVSETHTYLSWPNRWERAIFDWAMQSESNNPCPFKDYRGVLDVEYRQRLKDTILEAGGFLYRCEETHQIVFAPFEDLELIWANQDHLSEIDRNKPFGFFYDAGRPDRIMREPTEDETRFLNRRVEERKSRTYRWFVGVKRFAQKLMR